MLQGGLSKIHCPDTVIKTQRSFGRTSNWIATGRRHSFERATYTRARVAWSVVTREKWFSSMVRVPVSATWPQPQNNATPEKQRMVATREAYGTPPRHFMQHSKHPVGGDTEGEEKGFISVKRKNVCDKKKAPAYRLMKLNGNTRWPSVQCWDAN